MFKMLRSMYLAGGLGMGRIMDVLPWEQRVVLWFGNRFQRYKEGLVGTHKDESFWGITLGSLVSMIYGSHPSSAWSAFS